MSKIKPNKIDQIAQLQNIINKYERNWVNEMAKGDPNEKEKILRRLHQEGRSGSSKRNK